jgi:Zn-dependent protease with chaperone function
MSLSLALLVGAFAAGWLGPAVLRGLDPRRHDPVLLLVVWLVTMAGVLAATTAAVLLSLLPGHGPGVPLLGVVHRCWLAVQHGSLPGDEAAVGLLSVVVLAAVATRLVVVAVMAGRRRARRRREHLATLRLAARTGTEPADVLWLAHDRPLAFSMSGRPGVVVLTEGLTRHLDSDAVAAVLTHERAHLAGRHHQVLASAEAVRATLPLVPLFRRAPKAIGELLELAADLVAVRRHGTAAVRTALVAVAGHGTPPASLAMGHDAVGVRLDRLRHGPRPPGRVRRTVSCWLAGLTAATLPFLAGTGVLLAVALVDCPL